MCVYSSRVGGEGVEKKRAIPWEWKESQRGDATSARGWMTGRGPELAVGTCSVQRWPRDGVELPGRHRRFRERHTPLPPSPPVDILLQISILLAFAPPPLRHALGALDPPPPLSHVPPPCHLPSPPASPATFLAPSPLLLTVGVSSTRARWSGR